MGDKMILEAQTRTVVGKKVNRLRNEGLVPATVYGPKTPPFNVQIPARPLELLLLKVGGTSLIDLQVDGAVTTVITRDVQRHYLKRHITHVDFFAPNMAENIQVDVPIHFINESPAVESNQGVLITGPASLTVEALPASLPDRIDVDLSTLKVPGDSIHVRDLHVGEGIAILNDPDEMVARVNISSAARSEEAELLEGEGTVGEVEIIKKGKQDEEEF